MKDFRYNPYILMFFIISNFFSCGLFKNSIQKEASLSYSINISKGFKINFIEQDSTFQGIIAEVVNKCENIDNDDFDFLRYISLTDPNGNLIYERDSLSFSSHDRSTYEIGDKKVFRMNTEIVQSQLYNLEPKTSGIYSLKVEFKNDNCHFDIRLNQYVDTTLF